jgi:NAD-dependent SIR2 family protein deacetylase
MTITRPTRTESKLKQLITHLRSKRNIWILSGAGISAPSGIPTYRDHRGDWQAGDPIQHNDFISKKSARQRYWARSMAGWKLNERAKPNAAHTAVTKLQQNGCVSQIVTQNVDRLHSLADATNVIDLHGRIDQIVCLECKDITTRDNFQPRLVEINPKLERYINTNSVKMLPDGDAHIDDFDMSLVNIPPCENCGGILMPDVVFFGGTVPKKRVETAFDTLAKSDCILVIGSSLTVFSGFRFPRWAHQNNLPLYAINQGEMRGADMFDLIVQKSCEDVLPIVTEEIV